MLLALLVIAGATAAWRINAVRMGGAAQLESQQISDLVADILPPPEYIIEPYLEALRLHQDPSSYARRSARLNELHRTYTERHEFWAASNLEPGLKQRIVHSTDATAQKFWNVLEQEYLPAVRTGDADAVAKGYRDLTAAYETHRKAIDELVTAAAAYQRHVGHRAEVTIRSTVIWLTVLAAIILAMVGGLAWFVVTRVMGPMVRLTGVTTELAGGKAAEVPFLDRPDEIGEIARAVAVFDEAARARAAHDAEQALEQKRMIELLGERLSALREGDLARRIETVFPPAYEVLRENFNEAIGALRGMVQRVSDSAGAIDVGAREIAQASEDLARRTESGAATLTQTSQSVQTIESGLRGSMEIAERTVTSADQAMHAVSRGRADAERANASMDRVAAGARDIDSVIEGLDKIAFQTRVLAMNAAVEAGRAGEAGRGFAVVADLVSALALRAEEEAQRVRSLIETTQSDIAGAVEAVQAMDQSLSTIALDVEQVNGLLETLRNDNRAQAQSITEIAGAVISMDTTTQQNAAMVEQTSAAARNLSNEVAVLAQHAAAFRFERRQRNVAVAFDRRGGDRRAPRTEAPTMH
ncbi:MAG: methyl-accepting chemotaxis protein [Pseudomonadota bacterium]